MFFFFIFLLTLIGLQHLSQFVCHATTLHSAPHNLPIVGSTPPSPSTSSSPLSSSMQIESLHVNCTRDLFHMHLELNRPFHGLLYAKDFPLECLTRGKDSMQLHLRLPTSGCGVRAEFSPDNGGIMEYSVRIMLQMEQKLRQSTDIWRTVTCHVPVHEMAMSLPSLKEDLPMLPKERNPRMHNVAAVASSATVHHHHQHHQAHMDSPRIRIWLELGGPNGSGSVEVGMPTTLTVRAIVPGTIGVHVVDCSALDGLGESMQQLLDSRGCPIDEQVMPALHTRFKPAEEGWSKQHEEDLVERIFSATFPAFKFPDRERLHVSCGVQLCKGKCPNLNCQLNKETPLQVNLDQHLARIEVFNSLAVTAPQIEVDRLRYDRGYNISVEDYPPYVRPLPSEGTLCLSISKLAISFCILGLIFLVAVIVAILSLIRTRRRQQHCGHGGLGGVSSSMGLGLGTSTNSSSRLHRDRAEICTSMFSSSSGDSGQSANVAGGSRFGGKFLMPYYPHNLPYGRVY